MRMRHMVLATTAVLALTIPATAAFAADGVGKSGTQLDPTRWVAARTSSTSRTSRSSGPLAGATGSDLAFQAARRSSATTTASRSTTSPTRATRRWSARFLPGQPERHQRLRRPAVPVDRLVPQRQLVHQRCRSPRRSRSRGRASRSSTSATRPTPSTSSRRDQVRLAHPHPDPRQDDATYIYISSLLPERDLPGLPAAERLDRDHQGAAAAPGEGRGGATPNLFPDGGLRQRASTRLPRHHRLPGQEHRGRRLHG